VELAAEGEGAGAAVEGLFGGEASEVGGVVLLGDVGEDEVAGLGVEDVGIGEEIADDGIGEVAGAAHDALLDVPGVGADLEHVEIVIGFENQKIGVAKMLLDQLGHVAKVGDDGDLHAGGAEREADGIGGVVGDGEGRDFDIADFEFQAGADVFDAAGSFRRRIGEHFFDFAVRRLGEVGGTIPIASELGQAVAVVGVLVGDEDGVHVLGTGAAESFEAADDFLAAETGVYEESGAAGLEKSRIAGAAGGQNGDAKGDARRSWETRRKKYSQSAEKASRRDARGVTERKEVEEAEEVEEADENCDGSR